jgi:hypothetical protein
MWGEKKKRAKKLCEKHEARVWGLTAMILSVFPFSSHKSNDVISVGKKRLFGLKTLYVSITRRRAHKKEDFFSPLFHFTSALRRGLSKSLLARLASLLHDTCTNPLEPEISHNSFPSPGERLETLNP